MSVTLLPLDDRPCCAIFPQRLAALAGQTLRLPEREWLGNFQHPAQVERLLDWLADQPEPWLVSLDMAIFGGLVASRRPEVSLEKALERFARFEQMAEGRQVLAFQSILRAAPTQTTPEEVAQAERLVELGAVSVRAQSGDARAMRRAAELEALLSPEVVAQYHALRERNYSLNQLALRWALRTGQPLLLGLDDSKTVGWNVLEAGELQRTIEAASGQAWVAPGTDESALLLLARWLGPAPVRPVWWGSPRVVGLYEDRSLELVLAAQAAAAGVELSDGAERQLFLWAPHDHQEEASGAEPEPVPPEFLQALREALEQGPVAVADVRYANGADPGLAQALLESGLAARLTAFSGWNTAGNALGTALAALAVAGAAHDRERRVFLLERFADDFLYQSRVRGRLRAELGHGGLSLTDDEQSRVAGRLAEEMNLEVEAVARQLKSPDLAWSVRLPWQRLFEVEVDATGSSAA